MENQRVVDCRVADLPIKHELVDCEMPSQTETEDTDGGEANTSSSSDLNTTTDDSAGLAVSADLVDSTRKRIKSEGDTGMEKSVDLTDVTELSNMEDFSGVDRKNSYPDKLEDVEREIPKFDFSGNWHYQKCFQRYWNHYHQAMAWCRKHYQTYHELQQKYYGDIYTVQGKSGGSFSDWQHPYSNTSKPDTGYGRASDTALSSSNSRSKRRRRRRHKTKSQSSHAGSHKSSDTATQTSELEEFEMEITPEMIEFFEKSQKHKEERDELKKAQDNTEEERERINVEEVRISNERQPTVAPPKHRPGSKRTEEMKMLYGKGAAMIHGMETALQMTFDRNTDLKQPKMWPNMPLKIVFS